MHTFTLQLNQDHGPSKDKHKSSKSTIDFACFFYQGFLATVSLMLNQVYSNVKDRQNWREVILATIKPALTSFTTKFTNHSTFMLSLIHISEPTRPY